MSGASEVPADIQALALKIVRHCQNTPVLKASKIVGTILHQHIGSLARPVDTGREKALEEAATLVQTMVAFPSRRGGRVVIGRDAEDAIADAIRALANPENGRG